jgi:DNA modification methylase
MKLQITYLKTNDLLPYAGNSRTHSDEQVNQIAASIKEFGFAAPICVAEGTILAGHGRVMAARKLGLEEVPTVDLSHLTPAQRRQYVVADNKLALNAGWDEEMLAAEIALMAEEGSDLDVLGFTADELAELREETQGLTEPDEAPSVPAMAASVLGDVWVMGNHRVMCGSSTEVSSVEKLMAGEKAALWITDPPYNVAYEGGTGLTIKNDDMDDASFRAFLVAAYGAADAVMNEGAVFYVWHADSEGFNFRGSAQDVGWKVRQCLIWVKSSLVMGRQDYQWKHEPCLYGWKEGAAHYWGSDRKQTTVRESAEQIIQQNEDGSLQLSVGSRNLRIHGIEMMVEDLAGSVIRIEKPSRNAEHPTMKPVELFAYQIGNSSKVGGIVLDSFGGSGTTAIACEQLGRSARLMELDPKYVDVIVTRWQNFTGKQATNEATGKTFDETKAKMEGAKK